MDPKQEQRVWSRVMSAQAVRCTQEPEVCRRLEQKDIPVFDESAAMELYAAQCGAAMTYRCLAEMARGCARQALVRLAESRRCDGKRLSALYFVMTGLKACPDRPKLPCVSCAAAGIPRGALHSGALQPLCRQRRRIRLYAGAARRKCLQACAGAAEYFAVFSLRRLRQKNGGGH